MQSTVCHGRLMLSVLLGAVSFASASAGTLSLGVPFSDGAVLQRGKSVPVWGRADQGAEVVVSFAGKTVRAMADEKGIWRAQLPTLEASSEGRVLTIRSGAETKTVSDVLVGEVWLCSGQSNMEMPLVDPIRPRYRDGIGAMTAQMTDEPLVRYLKAPGHQKWHAFEPGFLSTNRCSALAVHYALELHAQLDIPIGVVVAAAGGSNIDNWQPKDHPRSACNGSFLADFYPYALRGVIWYQGETNIYLGEVGLYPAKLRRLYDAWSELFETRSLRFYYVQLAPFQRGKLANGFDYDAAFPGFLLEQASFEKSEPNAAMVVVNDLGCPRDIHPNEKWLVAKRLALKALKRDYGRTNLEDSSPELATATRDGATARLVFDHAKALYVYHRAKGVRHEAPFELAGADGVFKPAKILNYLPFKGMNDGTITNNVIELVAAGVAEPKNVRYAWLPPWEGVVYNDVNLPLATFSAEIKE